MTTVIEVPQWQASGSPTARRLAAGARLLADLVPGADRVTIDIADDLATTASRVRQALPPAGFVVTVGGDCGVELEPVAAARRKYGEGLVVVWFDAHADLNTPASSPSGAFHGMVLRALTGEGFPDLVPDTHLDPRRVVLAGVRALDPAEQSFITTAAIPHAPTEQSVIASAAMPADPAAQSAIATAETAADASVTTTAEAAADASVTTTAETPADASVTTTAETPAGPGSMVDLISALDPPAVYIHIDLDVLDPTTFSSVGSPAPGGLTPDRLLSLVTSLAKEFTIAGLGITEYEPATPDDQTLLTTLIPALVTTCAASHH